MSRQADIFVDIEAHIESGRFIRNTSTNKHDIRDFTFNDLDLRKSREVLDLGCSYGFFTRGLKGRLHPDAQVIGMDLWPGCEPYFLKACRESGFSGQFLVSDERFCKRFAEKNFDLVLCSYALYFFPGAIADIARILRAEGHFIVVAHSVPHMRELVDSIKKLLEKRIDRPPDVLPLEKLFDAFSDVNGYQMLSPWFREIREKKYSNTLRVDAAALPDLINYLCFKKTKFIPENVHLDDRFIRSDVADHLAGLLSRQKVLTISKDDTVFICSSPKHI